MTNPETTIYIPDITMEEFREEAERGEFGIDEIVPLLGRIPVAMFTQGMGERMQRFHEVPLAGDFLEVLADGPDEPRMPSGITSLQAFAEYRQQFEVEIPGQPADPPILRSAAWIISPPSRSPDTPQLPAGFSDPEGYRPDVPYIGGQLHLNMHLPEFIDPPLPNGVRPETDLFLLEYYHPVQLAGRIVLLGRTYDPTDWQGTILSGQDHAQLAHVEEQRAAHAAGVQLVPPTDEGLYDFLVPGVLSEDELAGRWREDQIWRFPAA